MDSAKVAQRLAVWYGASARDLPWRRTSDPWAILLSEVLLQQTRVDTGVPAFERLLAAFPTPGAFAAASEEQVLLAWAGLGYYRRARNLHAAAKAIVAVHGSRVPGEEAALEGLPGIGPYTAAAVRAFAFDEPAIPLDANVLRVLARLTGERGRIESPATRERLARVGLEVVREGSPRVLAQAIMELGALVCIAASPSCGACPLARACEARRSGQQAVIPRRRPAAQPRRERWAFARIVREGSVLVEQRGPGLLAGFWALPGAHCQPGKGRQAVLEAHLAQRGICAAVGPAEARDRWVFSHRVWEFTVHSAEMRKAQALPPSARWLPLDELDRLPVARPHLRHMQGPEKLQP